MSRMICPGCGIRMFSEKAFREHVRDCPETNKPEEVVQEPTDASEDAPAAASQASGDLDDQEQPEEPTDAPEASQGAPETAPEPAPVPATTGSDVIPTKDMTLEELRNIVKERGIPGAENMKKSQLFKALFLDPPPAPEA